MIDNSTRMTFSFSLPPPNHKQPPDVVIHLCHFQLELHKNILKQKSEWFSRSLDKTWNQHQSQPTPDQVSYYIRFDEDGPYLVKVDDTDRIDCHRCVAIPTVHRQHEGEFMESTCIYCAAYCYLFSCIYELSYIHPFETKYASMDPPKCTNQDALTTIHLLKQLKILTSELLVNALAPCWTMSQWLYLSNSRFLTLVANHKQEMLGLFDLFRSKHLLMILLTQPNPEANGPLPGHLSHRINQSNCLIEVATAYRLLLLMLAKQIRLFLPYVASKDMSFKIKVFLGHILRTKYENQQHLNITDECVLLFPRLLQDFRQNPYFKRQYIFANPKEIMSAEDEADIDQLLEEQARNIALTSEELDLVLDNLLDYIIGIRNNMKRTVYKFRNCFCGDCITFQYEENIEDMKGRYCCMEFGQIQITRAEEEDIIRLKESLNHKLVTLYISSLQAVHLGGCEDVVYCPPLSTSQIVSWRGACEPYITSGDLSEIVLSPEMLDCQQCGVRANIGESQKYNRAWCAYQRSLNSEEDPWFTDVSIEGEKGETQVNDESQDTEIKDPDAIMTDAFG